MLGMEKMTLKDIEFECSAVDNFATTWKAVEVDILRAVAIKWIKAFEAKSKIAEEKGSYSLGNVGGINFKDGWEAVDWIKHFFNITEEDLK